MEQNRKEKQNQIPCLPGGLLLTQENLCGHVGRQAASFTKHGTPQKSQSQPEGPAALTTRRLPLSVREDGAISFPFFLFLISLRFHRQRRYVKTGLQSTVASF